MIKICKNKPISLEVFAVIQKNDRPGFKINSWGKNVYVKVPL